MNVKDRIESARQQITEAKQMGNDCKDLQARLLELYKVNKRNKKPRVAVV